MAQATDIVTMSRMKHIQNQSIVPEPNAPPIPVIGRPGRNGMSVSVVVSQEH
jgi:hypothetical protein